VATLFWFLGVFKIRIVQVAVFLLAGYGVEKLAEADGPVPPRERIFNYTYTILYHALDVTGGLLLLHFLAAKIKLLPGHGLLRIPFADQGILLRALALAFLAIALRDFFYYWFHRWQHSSSWLWKMHAIHHSDEHVNVTTGSRHHWLEIPMEAVFTAAPMMYFFDLPAVTVPLAVFASMGMGYFIHLNSRLSLGPLTRVIANPRTHRIHHSRLPEHSGKNFAAFFPAWDILFGTYLHPRKNETPPTGCDVRIRRFRDAFAFPFAEWNFFRPKPLPEARPSSQES
jgi:sterol desaturase/sphingolipid hydroxylase (fatty acid hydroxylase superfamily)